MFQGIFDLWFVFSRQRGRVLRQEFEYVATNKIVAALIGYSQNIYNAERVVRDGKAVVFDY